MHALKWLVIAVWLLSCDFYRWHIGAGGCADTVQKDDAWSDIASQFRPSQPKGK